MDIFALQCSGLSRCAIARRLGIHRDTVAKRLTGGKTPGLRNKEAENPIHTLCCGIIDDRLQENNYRATWAFTMIEQSGSHVRPLFVG